jgi:crossover junction endodeoxyribonuclease RuvC
VFVHPALGAAVSAPVVVLGIDPGLTRCGLGIVRGPVARPELVHQDCLRTEPGRPLEQRLLAVHDAIVATIEAYRPDAVAVERVLFSSNVRTAMATGQAAGVALLAAARAGVPVAAYSPSDVKLTVAGAGDADKDAVGRLVTAQLRLAAVPRPADVADALAVALTHLARGRLAAVVAGTPAASELEAAAGAAAQRGRGGWEAHLAARGLLPPASGGRR